MLVSHQSGYILCRRQEAGMTHVRACMTQIRRWANIEHCDAFSLSLPHSNCRESGYLYQIWFEYLDIVCRIGTFCFSARFDILVVTLTINSNNMQNMDISTGLTADFIFGLGYLIDISYFLIIEALPKIVNKIIFKLTKTEFYLFKLYIL